MKLQTLDSYDFKGKKVLVRADLNSPVVKGKVRMNDRFIESAKTIKELKRKGASLIVILAHQGRPGSDDFISLKQHAKLLNKLVKIKFNTKDHSKGIILMENIRMNKNEFKPSNNNSITRQFKDFDIYVNDAFSVSHRNQTSIVSFPKVMKSCVGRVMESELKHLEKVKMKNCLYVLGGAKMEEVVGLIDGKRKVLTGSLLGALVLMANGQKLGETGKFMERKYFKKLWNPKNVTPCIDFAILEKGKRKELMLDELPSKKRLLDIGSKSIEIFKKEIKKAKSIFIKGPMGKYADKGFAKGTEEIFRAVANGKGFSVLGGGHSVDALKGMGISKKKFGYVSLSGGALVKYISGEKLVGIEALKKGKR